MANLPSWVAADIRPIRTKAAVGLLKPSRSVSQHTCPERDHMRSFRLTSLVTGAALSVSVASFAGHAVLAD